MSVNGANGASQFLTYRLKNGLTILSQFMPDVESVALSFHVCTGARDEHDEAIAGVSHFLEHMVFKGSQTRSAEEITLEFNNIGAEFNAFTSLEYTVYFARVLSEQFERALNLLSDMMYPRLNPQDFETERNVILEEIARSEDQPANVAFRRFLNTYFAEHPLGRDVLGTRESIRNLPLECMRDYWQRRYAANNMILAVAGKVDFEQLVRLAEERCGHWRTGETGRQTEPYQPAAAVTRVMEKPTLKQQHLYLGSPSVSMQDPDFYAAELLSMILGDATGSRLFWNVLQKGLAENVGASFSPFDGTGMFIVYASANPDNAPDVLRVLYAELRHLEEEGVQEDELRRAKDKLISHIVLDGESSYSRMRELSYSWLAEHRLKTLDEEIADVEAVTIDDIARLLKRFPLHERLVTFAYGPLDAAKLGVGVETA
jgi:predicted Zn-dependent peptidase